jgi:hypothetical protein
VYGRRRCERVEKVGDLVIDRDDVGEAVVTRASAAVTDTSSSGPITT